MFIVRLAKPSVVQEDPAFLFSERASWVNDFNLLFSLSVGRHDRKVGLRNPVIKWKTETCYYLFGGLGPTHFEAKSVGGILFLNRGRNQTSVHIGPLFC